MFLMFQTLNKPTNILYPYLNLTQRKNYQLL